MNFPRFWIALAAVLILFGIGAFVAYDKNQPVQHTTVYELPEHREVVQRAMPAAYTTSSPGDSQTSKLIEPTAVEDTEMTSDLAEKKARLEQAKAKLEKEKADLSHRVSKLEKQQAEAARMREEAYEFSDWLVNDFYREFKQTLDDGALIADSDLTSEEIRLLYPDSDSIQQFLSDLGAARGRLVSRIADLSPSVREPALKGLRRAWGNDLVDELEQSVAQELHERGTL